MVQISCIRNFHYVFPSESFLMLQWLKECGRALFQCWYVVHAQFVVCHRACIRREQGIGCRLFKAGGARCYVYVLSE